MRSHSRRDFYAKGLAVAGLGCLGAIGAFIDYLPQQGPLPEVIARAEVRVAETMKAISAPPRPGAQAATAAAAALDVAPVIRASFEPNRRVASLVPRPVQFVRFEYQSDVTNASAAVPELAVPIEEDVFELPLQPVTTLAQMTAEEAWDVTAPAPTLAFGQPDDGILSDVTGALRKAGSSVTSLGSKAGGAAAGAFRVVGGAMTGAWRRVF